jgi:hypothetical protein
LGDKDSWGSGMEILIVIGQLLPFLYVTRAKIPTLVSPSTVLK